MKKLPKHILNKMNTCHKYQEKSDNIMFEMLRWFEKVGHSDTDGEFQATLNEIQGLGIDVFTVEAMEEYLNYNK